ncbi:hypothetical protein FRC02_012032 [Tulasnella sp. 418]|nr:hypothetical protein FRC02_012032 [Tulasnella sp. 418]
MRPSTRSSSLSKGKLKTVDPVSEDASTQKAKTSGQQSAYYPLFYKKSNQGQSERSNNDKESASSQPTAWKEDAEDIDDLEDESKETTEGDINVEGTSGPNGSAKPNETSGTPLAPPKGSQDTVQRSLISVWDLPVPIIPQPSRKRPSSSTKRKPGAVAGTGRGKARSKLSAKVTAKVHQNVQQKDAEEYRVKPSEGLLSSQDEASASDHIGSPAMVNSAPSDSEVIDLSDHSPKSTNPPSIVIRDSSDSEGDLFLLTDPPDPPPHRQRQSRPSSSRLAPLFQRGSKQQPIEVVSSPPNRTELIDLTDDTNRIAALELGSGSQTQAQTKPIAGIFATTKAAASGRSTKRRKIEPKEAIWPYGAYQHQRGEQTTFDVTRNGSDTFRSRSDKSTPPDDRTTSYGDILKVLPPLPIMIDVPEEFDAGGALTSEQIEEVLQTIPTDHLRHPSITRLLLSMNEGTTLRDEHEMWNDRYRPRRAEEVLGNDLHAKYLRDWLRALALQPVRNAEAEQSGGKKQKGTGAGKEKRGVKRPAVIRAVEKPSKKKRKKNRNGYGDDDWIVSDDEDQEVRDDDGGTDWQSGYERSSPGFDESSGALYSEMASGRATSPFKPSSITSGIVEAASAEPLGATYYTFHTLTNCLLLTGPSGTGKTATVYACAEEMGWDVCELYPGIGKRTGAVMVSVGEGIGSNHVIGLGGSAATASTRAKVDAKAKKPEVPGGLKGFFKVKGGSDPLPTGTGTKDEPLLLEAPASSIENSEEKTTDIRQSIILIEEVDVLFAEDKNFWQGVVSLIGESRRPVILTCNDPNIVPIQDLPLQGTLTFEAPPGPLLASYLRILGLINNKVVAPDAAQELLSRSIYRPIGADLPDAPRHPLPYQEEPVVDMRKAINQLQFRCVHIDKEQEVDLQRLRTMYLGEVEEMQETLAEWSEVPGSSEARRTIDGHEDGKEAIEGLWKFMEVVSLMDSHLNRRSESSLEALSVDRYAESADDEIGYHHLPKMEYIGSGIAFYNREEEIGLESVILGRERLASSGTRVGVNGSTSGVRFDSGRLYASRGVHQLKLASYLDEIVDGRHVPLLPRGVMIMEYVGHIERMVKIEDERERLGGSERRGKRYVRQVGLSLGGLHVARDAMFPSW